MSAITIKTIPPEVITQYKIQRNDTFLRRDLYRFMNYVFDNALKRSHRENTIPRTDAKKLAKLLSFKEEMQCIEDDGCGYWSDYISSLARGMSLVKFDIEGKYAGYSSSERCYPENYIEPSKINWDNYLALNSLDKEWAILNGMNQTTENEFYNHSTLLNHTLFDTFGSAVNAASKMNLPKIRLNLLNLLYQLKPGIWYSIHDFISYLKNNHFDLIIDHKKRNYDTKKNIYNCFYEYNYIIKEGREKRENQKEIQENQKDGFERVEGRYFSFFLEELPFLMGFVDLAYDSKIPVTISPSTGNLKAFLLTQKFFTIFGKDTAYNHVKLTVQANHEIVVQYSGYAEKDLEFLLGYGKLIQDDQTLIFRLDKKIISDRVADGEDIKEIIRQLSLRSSSPIPQNILTEMEHWGRHGEKITLYRGYSLLEIDASKSKEREGVVKALSAHIEKNISSHIIMLKDVDQVFTFLEDQGYLPQKLHNTNKTFYYPKKTHSGLTPPTIKKKKIEKCEIHCKEFVGIICENKELLVEFKKLLEKKDIPGYPVIEKNTVFIPLPYKKAAQDILSKAAERRDIEPTIIQ